MNHSTNLDLRDVIREEMRYFDTDEQRRAFFSFAIGPHPLEQRWSYSEEIHRCHMVARGAGQQIVYCRSGFGPAFPWSLQRIGESDLGTDSQWNAYLYECFVTSDMWPPPVPQGFLLHGPGERSET